jgi:EAL domain-containing protein (putative c-di-GMP-specific phosphodiesterase class I)
METLLRHADVAMHRAKAAGRNDWCLFRADMDQPSTEQLLLEGGVRQAMEKNEWLLHYQPQIHAQTGALVAVEVLVRWHHSELGLLTPDRWIPLMEHQGHISELSAWVLRRACAQWVHWAGKGLNARLAVNVSASELTHPHFIPLLQGILQDTGMNPVQLELEITESALMKSLPALLAPCQALADMGVRLTLDDFGTGHAQLAPLIQSMHLPLRCIKIDRSFICDVPGDEADEATIHTMLTSAHALGLDVVAEGVERMQQREFLHAQHCDHIQGWWVARPMDAPLFEAWWQRHMQHNKQPAALHP